MAQNKQQTTRMQIVLFRGNRKVQTALLAVIVLTAIALASLALVERQMERKTEELRTQSARVQYENEVLEQNIQELGSAKSVERIAREELGMVSADTILIESQVK